MKNVDNIGAQGDMLLIRVDQLPDGLVERKALNGQHVLAHSETGHHHTVTAKGVGVFDVPDDGMVCYLRIEGDPVDIVHHRTHDTHETLVLRSGLWRVQRQREYTPEGWRRVED